MDQLMLPLFTVDFFSVKPFAGNPAADCPGGLCLEGLFDRDLHTPLHCEQNDIYLWKHYFAPNFIYMQ